MAVYENGSRRPGKLELEDAYEACRDGKSFAWIELQEPTEEEFDSAVAGDERDDGRFGWRRGHVSSLVEVGGHPSAEHSPRPDGRSHRVRPNGRRLVPSGRPCVRVLPAHSRS